MAASGGVARRYARAVFEIAVEQNDLDGWLRDLGVIRDVLSEPTLAALLENPEVSFDEKATVTEAALRALPTDRRNLVKLLIENRRADSAGRILTVYQELVNQRRGVVEATVTTAVPMGPAELQTIAQRLGEFTDRTVRVSTQVDPSIIGGFVARIGDRMIDASVAGRLASLRTTLMN